MTKLELLGATAIAMLVANPAYAQTAPQASTTGEEGIGDIVVTAQRQSETLQSVPIAVSAFDNKALEAQQIKNASDLQLTLPNVVFSKGQFTASSFTIRGIGDLCVGNSCDAATAIHVNGSPLAATRLFETEYFDLERIEVLRGPQGTLFGRNATSGVVNFITAKPDLTGFHAAADAEYGNFNAYKFKGMINVPIGDTLAVRIAGVYQKRDGYTKNLFDGSRIDGRDQYSIRGSIRWQPSDATTVDLMGYYFHERDSRLRSIKQLCQTDTNFGIMGCTPGGLVAGYPNGNTNFFATLTSREFLAFQGIPSAFGLGSLYGPDTNAGSVSPSDVRQVKTDFRPEYFTDEQQYQARIDHEFGAFNIQLTGLYQKSRVDSRQDPQLDVANRATYAPGLNTLAAAAAGLIPGLPAAYFTPIAAALIPGGPNGPLCVSDTEPSGVGSFGGKKICAASPLGLDRSLNNVRTWSTEAILTSKLDGKLNFLLGGIYSDSKVTDGDYYVNHFGIDYVSGILGTFGALSAAGGPLPPSFLGTPYFRNNAVVNSLKSYGLFGEAYYTFNDKLKLTLGLRYNHDKKDGTARSTLANFLVPFGSTSAFSSPFAVTYDADAARPGIQAFQIRTVSFGEFTGRAVLDYQLDRNHLLYASYSRGYKSGGINPPIQPQFNVPDGFSPEFVDSFEIGSKNSFLNGSLRFNLTAFYYKYKSLQLARIVNRTAVNDNVDANIYGLEAEAIIKPSRELLVNLGFSYLHTKVATDKFLGNPRDPSGGRSDTVIIKDITNASNCAVVPTVAGNAAGSAGFVTVVNNIINAIGASRNAGVNPAPLRGPTPFGTNSGLTSPGAYSICSVLDLGAKGQIAALNPAFAPFQAVLNSFGSFTVEGQGVPVNIKGNHLPQAPNYKFSAGVQYTAELSNGMAIVPRVDLTYTGDSYGNIFNGAINRIRGYSQINAQIQLNGRDDRWYLRGYIQNVTNNSATTGLYVSDQSQGVFTNIFTLEPRRYGITAGVKF